MVAVSLVARGLSAKPRPLPTGSAPPEAHRSPRGHRVEPALFHVVWGLSTKPAAKPGSPAPQRVHRSPRRHRDARVLLHVAWGPAVCLPLLPPPGRAWPRNCPLAAAVVIGSLPRLSCGISIVSRIGRPDAASPDLDRSAIHARIPPAASRAESASSGLSGSMISTASVVLKNDTDEEIPFCLPGNRPVS